MTKETLVTACIVLCFLPTYFWYVRRIGTGGESGLSVLVLPCVLWLASQAKTRATPRELLTMLGICAYALTWGLHLPALIKAVVAITVLLYRFGHLRNPSITALSYLTLPWLDSMQFFLGYPLRRVVAEVSALGLQSVGLEVLVSGTGLAYQHQQVFVDPPCSGVRMLWVGIVLSAILSVIFRLRWQRSLLLYSFALFLLIVANSVRGMTLFFPEAGLVHWPEWTHEGVGLLLYTLCVFALITISQRLSHHANA